MAVQLRSTRDSAVTQGLKILVHGPSGAGKTKLCATAPGKPIIISAEAGLLSLRDVDIPVLEVASISDVHEAYAFLISPEGQVYDWVCIDSISEIAEVVLNTEKKLTKDPRQAYGALAEQMTDLVRAFRDLPGRNVYMSCKQDKTKDEQSGAVLYGPSAPGQRMAQALPYFFDEVFAYRVEKDPEGNTTRWLQTGRDFTHEAKDRSGALDMFEVPDLAAIAKKIVGTSPKTVAAAVSADVS
ncbi:phage nucleotide-binding protein [Variovorax sp. PBS-H4]|uniref:ATP-binding protein n=1 Tax=Variovorax sp. PBS-H4 TaxID=434008 RepID=UPI0013187D4F|nr:ATP-binding protein [Variovorax sp. PBS-H4]VTU25201.1 phage nucleotide-binding protein [Variovorax sp. PBS-H4]